MIERVIHENLELAIIVRRSFKKEGIEFFSDSSYSQQLAYMSWPKGYEIPPHTHNSVFREIHYTKEVLIIRSGQVRVDFYNDDQSYIESRLLYEGDIILLAHGGHGFEIIADAEMVEVKQGPYAGDNDKTRFKSIERERIKIAKGED